MIAYNLESTIKAKGWIMAIEHNMGTINNGERGPHLQGPGATTLHCWGTLGQAGAHTCHVQQ